MKKRKSESQYSTPPGASQQSHDALDETRALFEQMKSRVEDQARLEREEARSRGPLVRLLLILTMVACLLAAATMLYGIYNFPDAPIRRSESGYVGKGGKPHTQDDFEAFILWEKAIVIIIPTAFVFGAAFVITDSRQRRKRKAGNT